jgi:hypothetical protein
MTIYTSTIQQMYVAYFNRPADISGLANWEAYAANKSLAQLKTAISTEFAKSAEYTIVFTGMTTSQIVTKVYNNLLNRDPDAPGLQNWINHLADGSSTISSLVTDIVRDAGAGDVDTIANKVLAAQAFSGALDTVAEINAYSGAAANAVAATWLSTVGATAASLTAATTTAALNTVTANVVSNSGANVGTTFTLTTGVDSIVGTGNNDIINATNTTFTGLDSIDGGNGVDTLNIADVAGASVVLTAATIKNVENLVLSSTTGLNGAAADISKVAGLTSGTFTLNAAAAGQTVTASTAQTLNITNTAAQALTVVGGSGALNIVNGAGAVVAGQDTAPATTDANKFTAATIKGGTTVAVTDNSGVAAAGTADGSIGSTLTTVSLDTNTGAATLTGKGITSVTVANGVATSDVTIVNTTASHTQNLTVNNNATGVVIKDANATTVNITSTGKASAVALEVAAATTITATANGADLTLDTTGAVYTALTKLNIAGANKVTADVSGATLVTAVDASASTGGASIIIDATKATYTGGAGVDTVTIAAAPTKAINGGAGTADELVLNVIAATFSNASANTNITGFETLGLGASANGAYDATGFTTVHAGATAAAVSFTNVAAGTGLLVDGIGAGITYGLKDASGTSDILNVTIKNAGTAALAAGSITTAGIETVNITTTDAGTAANTAATIDTATLVATSATKITVSGNNGLTLTNTGNTKVTTFDASGVVGNGADDTAANLKVTFVSDNSTTTAAVSITGGAGNDVLTGNAAIDTINGGAGNDTIASGTGLDVLTGGAGADTFVLSKNVNGNTYAAITDFNKTVGAVTGDTINLSAMALVLTATTSNLGAVASLGAKVSLASTAAFADYLNAATAGDGSATAAVKWFQFGGDTYIALDNSAASTFQNSATTGDQIVKLVGAVDLTSAAISAVTVVGSAVTGGGLLTWA